ncbi:MAG TPA: ABC transporter permease [Verrucomicrobiota bacterium]|nr:ABC transporter permease [Verrucomicrobiota bacterium]HRZ38983.1 ABC transporter permease [Candidatus Paceibacterota bacterium]
MHDLRFALRQLRRNPGFTAVAVLMLALGIGVNTMIFSIANGVVLRPLPFHDPERLVFLFENNLPKGVKRMSLSYPDYLDWKAQNTVFADLGLQGERVFTLTGRAEPVRVEGAVVTASLFSLLGVQPMLGRQFTSDEDQPGAAPVAILSHGLWQQRFGGDADLAGLTLTLDGRSHTVVGIMPPGFAFPEAAQLWTPLVVDAPESQRPSHLYKGLARLKPGVTLDQAGAELNTIARRIAGAHPKTHTHVGATLGPLRDYWVDEWSVRVWLLLGAVSFVLAIACANVANLLLARALSRRKEFAIRAALGATRWRTIRQLLIESFLLSGAGALIGLALARWGVDAFLAVIPVDVPFWMQFSVDGRVLAFTLAVATVTSVLFGLAPAWGAARADLTETLKDNARSATGGHAPSRLRRALVVAEVALAVVLLSGAGLMTVSFLRLLQVDPGFNPERVVVFDVSLPPEKYADASHRTAFYRSLCERLSHVPGVQAAAGISHLPFGDNHWANIYTVEGQEALRPSEVPYGPVRVVTPAYFRTLEIPLLKGRDFSDIDTGEAPGSTIIDAAFARRYFPTNDPRGHRIKLAYPSDPGRWMTIVGVAGEARQYGFSQKQEPGFYLPHAQVPFGDLTMTVRTAVADPASVTAALRHEVHQLDPDLPVANLRTMPDVVNRSCWAQRLLSQLFALFSVLGIALAAVGIYAVMACSVLQRTHEIGVRMALGARRSDVLKLVVRHGMGAVVLGMILGLAANLALLRLLAGQLYEVGPFNLPTYAAAALLLLVVASVACSLPARRAARVDPMVALRCE